MCVAVYDSSTFEYGDPEIPTLKPLYLGISSRKHLRTKVTPDFHLTYSKNGGNLGSESK